MAKPPVTEIKTGSTQRTPTFDDMFDAGWEDEEGFDA